MSSFGSTGTDEHISAAKIQPLDSAVKYSQPHAPGPSGVAGTDHDIEHSRIEPIGGRGQHQHQHQHEHVAPHANTSGVIGRDEVLQGTKIDPLSGKGHEPFLRQGGLDDEDVDCSRIDPLGEVRE